MSDFFTGAGESNVLIEWAPHRDEPERVARDLQAAAQALENMHKMMVAAREVVVGDVKQHFASQSGPDGPWRPRATIRVSETFYTQTSSEGDPLTPGDIGYKSEEQSIIGLGGPLLQKTGAGMAGATARSSYTIESDPEGGSITFTADPPHYMLEHNRGIPDRETTGGFWEGPNPLPQREWLWLSAQAEQGIYRLFEEFVDDAVAIVMNPLTGGAEIRTQAGFFLSPTAFYG